MKTYLYLLLLQPLFSGCINTGYQTEQASSSSSSQYYAIQYGVVGAIDYDHPDSDEINYQ